MSFFAKLKKKLRGVVPCSRLYLDRRIDKVEKNQLKEILDLIDKQNRKMEIQTKMIRNLQGELPARARELRAYMEDEIIRHDEWNARAAATKLSAAGKPVWMIKCPAPEDDRKTKWGDYSYAVSLKKYLERMGLYVEIDNRNDWYRPMEADVVIVLRGIYKYYPDRSNEKTTYIMWNLSHPDDVEDFEYELYDAVCVCSDSYAQELKGRVTVPVFALQQCTDTEIFYPRKAGDPLEHDYIFIGNSRGVERSSVMWSVERKIPFELWGGNWNVILKDHREVIVDTFVPNEKLPELYRSSKVTLNDHWSDMLEKQYVNNRIFDAIACGLPVISDYNDALKSIFPEAVLCYRNQEEFNACIDRMERDYDAVQQCVLEQWPLIQEKYSFERRAKDLVEIAENVKTRNE